MKSLFRKIGKGLSNVGKAISKVFNSKVGRVIGTLSLAAGMFGLFQVLASGGVGAGTLAATPGTTLAGTSAGTTASAATSGVTTATTGAGAAATTTTTVGSASAGTSAATAATQLGGRVAEAGQTLGGATVAPITTEAVTKAATEGANILTNYSDVANAAVQSKNLLTEAASSGRINDFFPSIQNATKTGLDFFKDASTAKDLPGYETYGTNFLKDNPSATSSDIDMFVRSKQRSKDFADYLANTENRDAYDAFAKKYDLQPSNAYARQEFATLQDAVDKGEGFFDTTGNVIQYGLEADVTSVTGGQYTGFGGTSNVARTTTTAASLLTPPEELPEPPSRSNLYASSIASSQLDTAESLASAPTMSETVQLNNSIAAGSNPMQTLNSIRSNAGYSQVYGPYFSMSS